LLGTYVNPNPIPIPTSILTSAPSTVSRQPQKGQSFSPAHLFTIGGRGVWVCGTLHRMDAVAELTWTYLQRVPHTHMPRPNQRNTHTKAPALAVAVALKSSLELFRAL